MSTWSQSVWSASILISIEVTSNQTSVNEVVPSSSWETTVATHTARGTAGHQILSGDSSLDSLIGSDTNSVRHSFGGTESPARSAVSLVSDFTQGSTLWPLGSGIETVWSSNVEAVEFGNVWKTWGFFEEGTHQVFNFGFGHLVESAWFDSSPGSVHGVNLLSNVSDSVGVSVFLSSALVNSKGSDCQKNDN
jgi:hypothetical protein